MSDDKGRRRVRASVKDSLATLARAYGPVIPDPELGEPRDGVLPGQWQPEPDGMPPGCPVRVLGKQGDILYLLDTSGQLLQVKDSRFGVRFVQLIFGNRQRYAAWAWPRWKQIGKTKNYQHVGFAAEQVTSTFYEVAGGEPPKIIDPTQGVRGRGAWRDKSEGLVVHAGELIYIKGRAVRPCEYDDFVYPTRPGIFGPWGDEVPDSDNPAVEILQALTTWNFRRRVDALFIFGWICSVLLGPALKHRPVIFTVGDMKVGKTTLQFVFKAVLQGWLMQTPETSAAGIYQKLGFDAIGVAVDELEADVDNFKQMAILRLARLAYSGGEGHRGGADGVGTQFNLRSAFSFGAINAPPMEPADYSRMAVIQIDAIDPEKAASEPTLRDVDTIGPRLLRRLMDAWPGYEALLTAVNAVLKDAGHDDRGRNTFGTLITCAYLALGEDGAAAAGFPTIERLEEWGKLLPAADLVEREGMESNWRGCLTHLLTARIEAYQHGARNCVGDVLRDLVFECDEPEGFKEARKQLGRAGLGLIEASTEVENVKHVFLAIPNKGKTVQNLFFGTKWYGMAAHGVWMGALRQGPRELVEYRKEFSGREVNGVRQRCTLINLSRFKAIEKLEDRGMAFAEALREAAKR